MVKFLAISPGAERPLFGIGLSNQNLNKLREGLPILLKGSELNIAEDILILFGDTEMDIKQAIIEVVKGGNCGTAEGSI